MYSRKAMKKVTGKKNRENHRSRSGYGTRK